MLRNASLVLGALVCFSAGTLPAAAQTSAQFQVCDKTAKTQFALDVCASNELALRNKQMQSVYSTILSRFARQPATLAKVKAMQNAWQVYVTAYLDALYPAADKQAEYGSIYPMEADLNKAALTQAHTQDLREIVSRLTPR
jgi:uncharacterized protein YecT (DUF1311 family)